MIEIGSQKQIFLDDYLIESMTGAKEINNDTIGVHVNYNQ